jgi:hypothetical protein
VIYISSTYVQKEGGEEEKMIVVAHYTPTGLHRILYRI